MPNEAEVYTTRCRLMKDGEPCGHTVKDYALPIQEPGAPPDGRTKKFIEALLKHLNKRHADAIKTIQNETQFFSGLLILTMYETEDPALRQSVVTITNHIRPMFSMPAISDADIETAAANAGYTMDDPMRAKFILGMQQMRDHYEAKMIVNSEAKQEKMLVSP